MFSQDNHPHECPKAGQIEGMCYRLKRIELELDQIKEATMKNAEYRLYNSGVEEGKRLTDKGILKYINIAVLFLGTSLFCVVIGLFTYVTLGAEQSLNILKTILKILNI